MRAAAPICAVALAAALAGCGGDDEAQVHGVVKDFAKAVNSRDGKTFCTKLTKTEVHGDRATVTAELELEGQRRPQVFNLRKENGSFRLTTGQTR